MNKIFLCFVTFILLSSIANAETTKKKPVKPAVEETKKVSDWQFSGYIDGSYNYLVKSNKFTSGVFDRVYDLEENGFTLQQAAMTLAKQPPKGLGGLINI